MTAIQKLLKLPVQVHEMTRQLRFARLFFQLVNNPNDTKLVFKLADLVYGELRKQNPEEISNYLRSNEIYRQALTEKYVPQPYCIEDLANYAPGTLGQAYIST